MEIDRQRGLPGSRAVLGGVLVALAAIGVFVAYQQAGRDPRDAAVVATTPIRVGEVIEADDVALAELDLGSSGASTFDRVDAVVGRVALGPIGEGELLQASSITDAPGEFGLHEVAITLPGSQIAVGRLKAGERVDVFATADDSTATVARGAQVVEISAEDDASLTSNRDITVVVAVADGDEVAALVHALRTGDVTVVRSTFADSSDPLTFEEGPDDSGGSP
jgi:Flp pilus assembly protein CpaB